MASKSVNPKIWITLKPAKPGGKNSIKYGNYIPQVVGAYESYDKALEPVREACREIYPDIDESAIQTLIDSSILEVYKDFANRDTYDIGLHDGNPEGDFEITCVELQ